MLKTLQLGDPKPRKTRFELSPEDRMREQSVMNAHAMIASKARVGCGIHFSTIAQMANIVRAVYDTRVCRVQNHLVSLVMDTNLRMSIERQIATSSDPAVATLLTFSGMLTDVLAGIVQHIDKIEQKLPSSGGQTCPVCKQEVRYLRQHMIRYHPNGESPFDDPGHEPGPSATPTERQNQVAVAPEPPANTSKCPMCKLYVHVKYKAQHMIRYHPNGESPFDDPGHQPSPSNSFQAQNQTEIAPEPSASPAAATCVCGTSYASIAYLAAHVKRCALIRERKNQLHSKAPCRICGEVIPSLMAYSEHYYSRHASDHGRMQHKKLLFYCTGCREQFRSIPDLTRHWEESRCPGMPRPVDPRNQNTPQNEICPPKIGKGPAPKRRNMSDDSSEIKQEQTEDGDTIKQEVEDEGYEIYEQEESVEMDIVEEYPDGELKFETGTANGDEKPPS